MGLAALPLTAVVLTGAGTAVSSYASYQSGRAQSKAARHNARIAALAEADARARGDREEQRYRRGVSRLLGRQRATIGASGVTVDVGSPLDVIEETAALGELDALTIRNNAAREAWGFDVQRSSALLQASQARTAGLLSGVSALLGGGAQTFGTYYNFRYN